jgi:surface protein
MKKSMFLVLLAFVFILFGCGGGSGGGDNPSSAKAITSFIFGSPAATGEIDETDHTISIAVPSGTAVTALEPTIAHTGESISPESGVAQDFSNPVTYTVTAEDGSTQDYLVTLAYKAGKISKADQTAFSAGSDQNKLVTDADFTQAATGVEGTGTTSYLSSNTDVATVNAEGTVHIVGAGTTQITADNPGDETYNGASDSYLLTVSKLDQTDFSAGSDQNKLVTDDDFSQEATGVEGTGTTTYESSNTAVATVDTDGLVHIAGAGTAEIIAVNSGDETYNAASDSYLLTVRLPEFITYWQTDDDGQITIPVLSDETEPYEYDYSIDWGDAETDTGVTGEITHTYSEAGTYEVKITGDFPAIHFASNSTEALKILTIKQWGGIKWKSMAGAFYGCKNLEYNATDTPDLAEVTDMSSMFRGASSFNGDLSGWNVENVTDMSWMFCDASSFNGDISGWDVGNVIDMGFMFYSATSFSNHDLSGWDVSNVTRHLNFSYNWGEGNTEPIWP